MHSRYRRQTYRGATTVLNLGGPTLGLRYYYPFTKKLDRSTQFDAVGYIISHIQFIKKPCKKLVVRPNFGEVQTRHPTPVVAPMQTYRYQPKTTIFFDRCNKTLHYYFLSVTQAIQLGYFGRSHVGS